MTTIAAQYAEPPLILTVDIGSSSTRTLLFDREGREVLGSLARVEHSLRSTADGGVEDDAPAALERVATCIDQTLAQVGALATQIGAVALDSYVSNVLGVDAAGQPLTPIYLYADTRSSAAARELRARLDEQAILQRTGCPLHSSYLPARLYWLQLTQPAIVRQVARWFSLGEYLFWHWFGHTQLSFSVASWSGLLNRHSLTWDAPLLAELGLDPAQFSPLVDANAALHGLRAPYAARWPSLAQIPWFPAIGDGAAANLGSGCTTAARVALTVGTTGALRVVLPSLPKVPAGLWCYRVDRQRILLGGATSEGGNLFAWLRSVLQLGDPVTVEAALAAGQPDAHGLTVLPFLAGERSPGWASDLRASIVGLSLNSTALDILHAGLEAVAYRFALIAQLLIPQLPDAPCFVANGGALLNSPAWAQICADVLGQPLYASAITEPSSRGAALLALESLGVLANLEALPLEYSCVYTPDAARHQRYCVGLERQQQVYAALLMNSE